jgi:xanthine/uracil/vitamin C permease (AzgA family)
MTDDPMIRDAEKAEAEDRTTKALNLFDLRRIIGGLFLVYGVILTIVGITDSQKEIDKAAGININLWTGIGMLVVGAIFIAWALSRPLGEQLQDE